MPAKIAKQDLLADLRRVADIVEGVPSYDDYKQYGEYSLEPIKSRFGGIVNAREEAGIGNGALHGVEVPEEDVLEDLSSVADKLGKPPSWREYDGHGEYSAQLILRKFGGMETARVKAGLGPGPEKPKRVKTESLISDIQRVNDRVDGVVTQQDIQNGGKYSLDTYVRRFGSWSEAVEAAGLEPNTMWHTGEDNHAWRGGNSHNYGSRKWRLQREKAIRRDAGRCQSCGMAIPEHIEKYGRSIEVHHITPIRQFDTPEGAHTIENLVTLCRAHHRKYEELPANECEKLRS